MLWGFQLLAKGGSVFALGRERGFKAFLEVETIDTTADGRTVLRFLECARLFRSGTRDLYVPFWESESARLIT